ncbi:MAG: potassium transporter Trk [Dethiosulfovibrio peptidovorans]|nr:MAG: potassium transporter Trk [Dethiosulfovibrio peptidovorans]
MKTYSAIRVERVIVGGFLSLIVIGALLLWGCNRWGGQPLSVLDALFTSTSAVCVTGLTVVDTGTGLSVPSQWILLALIQLGGLGVMTAATFALLLFRRHIGIRERLLFAGSIGLRGPSGAVRLVARIVKMTLLIEGVCMIPLFFGFHQRFDVGTSLWYALFHSVSAFCNAGFSPFSDSLARFTSGWFVSGVVMVLIVLGGVGFVVLWELWSRFRYRRRLSVHTRLVLVLTVALILSGTAILALTEWTRGLAGFSPALKLWNALFCSVTPRTAGFNTISMGDLSSVGVFVIMLLMVIGASPGSTGGGMKTTTFGLLMSSAFFNTRGESQLVLWRRTVAQSTVLQAMMLAILYMITLVAGILLISLSESLSFRSLVFEVVSALGTVGLSMGITSELSWIGKCELILLMFWGRVGILTFMFSVLHKETSHTVTYAEAPVSIG